MYLSDQKLGLRTTTSHSGCFSIIRAATLPPRYPAAPSMKILGEVDMFGSSSVSFENKVSSFLKFAREYLLRDGVVLIYSMIPLMLFYSFYRIFPPLLMISLVSRPACCYTDFEHF